MKKKWRVLALAVCLVAIALLFVRLEDREKKEPSEEFMEKFEAALGDEWTKKYETRIQPFTLADADGNTIIYYVISTTYYDEVPEMTGLDPALNEIIDPDTVDSNRICKVCDLDAMLYEKNERAFLCWTVSAECSLAIEYSPDIVSESDIFRMAESIPICNGEDNRF